MWRGQRLPATGGRGVTAGPPRGGQHCPSPHLWLIAVLSWVLPAGPLLSPAGPAAGGWAGAAPAECRPGIRGAFCLWGTPPACAPLGLLTDAPAHHEAQGQCPPWQRGRFSDGFLRGEGRACDPGGLGAARPAGCSRRSRTSDQSQGPS